MHDMEVIVRLWRRLAILCLLLTILFRRAVSVPTIPDAHHLNFALHHFDVLHKDHLSHKQVSKSFREIHFTTLDRNFRLHLIPRKHLFHKNVQVHVIGDSGERSRHGIHFDHFYEGHLFGEPNSLVVAHLDHRTGELTASISTQHDHYYIEPSRHHISVSHDFHMISYRASDMKYNLTSDPSLHFCGTGAAAAQHLPVAQNVIRHHHQQQHHSQPSGQNGLLQQSPPRYRQDFEKSEGGRVVSVEERGREAGRLRRQASTLGIDSCPMELVATYSFVELYGREGIGDVVQYLIQLIDTIDQEMYRKTDWIEGSSPLGLSIKKITLHSVPTEAGMEPIYNQRPPSGGWNSNLLLTHFSHANWSDVCLTHLFTSDPFSDGRLGVAYIASPADGLTGGICSQDLTNFNGAPITTANVGISSLHNGQRRLLLAEAQLITAHEIGHNWGSDHDPINENPCNPSLDNGGKFLMYQSVNDGTLRNNNKFSLCSQASVQAVLIAKSSSCFERMADMMSVCGNFAVEEGEFCDGGFDGMMNKNDCCNDTCHFKEGAVCSDVNDACCSGCLFANSTTVCREYASGNLQCFENVRCTGSDAKCPINVPTYVPIETSCRVDGKCYPPNSQCASGSCTVHSSSDNSTLSCYNFCELHNLTQCFCPGEDDCKTCCRSQDSEAACQPFGSRNLPDGTTCLGGLCKSGTCELTTPDLVNRLYRLFTDISIDAIVVFMRENIVGSVVIFTLLVWIPGCLLVHFCIDVKVWKKIVDMADQTEKERLNLNQEDELDFAHCDSIAQDYPDINPSKAKRGLQRMASRTESVYDYDMFSGVSFNSPMYDHPPVFELESPMRPYQPHTLSIIAEELDPAKDNILAYMSTSVPSGNSLVMSETAV